MSRIITITSGKGGVGKTNLSVNLAIRLAELGFKTCLFDADLGLANINILLGLVPEYTLADLIDGRCRFEDLLIRDIHGIDIIPGSTGVSMLADLGVEPLELLIRELSALEHYDYILIDTAAGISKQVIAFCMAASHVILTVIPEPTSLTDGYSLLKVLHQNGYEKPACVLINRSRNNEFGERIFNKFKDTVHKFLPITIQYLGALANDDQVSEAVARQTPFILAFPGCEATRGVKDAAARLNRMDAGTKDDNSMTRFLRDTVARLHTPATKKQGERRPAENIELPVHDQPDTADRIEKDELVNQVLMALTRLVTNTDRIAEELSALRQAMETRDDTDREVTEPRVTEPVINLDFEKYVQGASGKRLAAGLSDDKS